MTNRFQTFIPKKFDQSELDARIANAKGFHNDSIIVDAPSFREALQLLKKYEQDKYVLNESFTPLAHPGFNNGSAMYQFSMTKPLAMQKKELQAIVDSETQAYKEELKADEADALEKMTTRILIEQREALDKQHEAQLQVIRDAAHQQAKEILLGANA